MSRYAVFVMPNPDTPLWRVGCSILGYDATTGLDVPFPDHAAYHDPLSLAWSAEPRPYGFHGTLKAPFKLAEHATPQALEDEMTSFAAGRKPFGLDLKLSVVGHFLALVPVEPNPAMQALADDCVRHFDPFRAPLSPEDRERRHPDDLIQRQVENLDTWGYPYVLEDFQFHMTLTGALEADERHRLEPILQEVLADAAPLRLTVDSLALFVQPEAEGRFAVQKRFPFRA